MLNQTVVTVGKPTAVRTDGLPQAFSEALQADLSAQYDREELDRWLSDGAIGPREQSTVAPSPWKSLGDAVALITRQMRMHGYYPEQVLIAIKSAVRDAAVPLVAEHLVKDIICASGQWCITAYFEPQIDGREGDLAAPPGVLLPRNVQAPGAVRSPTLESRR